MPAKNFFIVKGSAVSDTSPVNAFDKVLVQTGLDNVNIIPVSSIISGEAIEIKPKRFETGEIVYTVLSKNTGVKGDQISAGLIWGVAGRGGEKIGLVITAQQNFIDDQFLEKTLRDRLQEMSFNRGMRLERFKLETASLEVKTAKYGCVAVIFVYVF
ncbi:MAG: pyruvoyl-dependent arginine decarboxylase [Candidatus Odinarchaeum yellowstonii]|uniref:arginine decarboxylase n=1 Tax=Odinarchaeota yellowstonii (strain LCB_4) TaxID=1841599 RepID=A0AAF0IAA7_ODILC|nr:MAG: pyruvoyl-dependent arginine decarboxylase [Candidatus Odinarchaeum yellowstonii]